jgi:hypothetical protein
LTKLNGQANIRYQRRYMLQDVIKPVEKQIQILNVEFGELEVEKNIAKTGKNAAYFIYVKLACKALNYAVELLGKAEQARQRSIQ